MTIAPHSCLHSDGAALCEVLDWDSSFFGRPIAKVSRSRLTSEEATQVRKWAIEHRIKTVYFLAQLDDISSVWAAEAVGFRLVDVRVTYEHKSPKSFSDARVRAAVPGDQAELEAIASRAFESTRFACDPAFGAADAARLYREWLRKSLGGWAKHTLVAESQGRPAGFVTCHLNTVYGSIGLIAVDAQEKGKGWGQALVRCANGWLQQAGALSISVVTQGANLQAQRVYQSAGFTIKSVEIWFHLTLGQDG